MTSQAGEQLWFLQGLSIVNALTSMVIDYDKGKRESYV